MSAGSHANAPGGRLITVASLCAMGVAPTQARTFADPMHDAAWRWGIDTPVRVAAWLAQLMHESAGLARLEESLWYTTPERIRAIWPTRIASLADAAALTRRPEALANRVYAGRLGNGDEASGDGWRYRGRGLIQLTGRGNYRHAGLACARPWERHPELLGTPADAALSAGWYWSRHDLNRLADAWQGADRTAFDRLSTAVNRGPGSHLPALGEADRRQWAAQALEALHGAPLRA